MISSAIYYQGEFVKIFLFSAQNSKIFEDLYLIEKNMSSKYVEYYSVNSKEIEIHS